MDFPREVFTPEAAVALPLRVGRDGRLVRSDPREALVALIRVMAGTPRSAWPHAPWFGLQEVFAAAHPATEEQPAIAEALNAAFVGLGVRWARVLRVTSTGPYDVVASLGGERPFGIVLETDGRPTLHAAVRG